MNKQKFIDALVEHTIELDKTTDDKRTGAMTTINYRVNGVEYGDLQIDRVYRKQRLFDKVGSIAPHVKMKANVIVVQMGDIIPTDLDITIFDGSVELAKGHYTLTDMETVASE